VSRGLVARANAAATHRTKNERPIVVVSADAVNRHREFMIAKPLVGERLSVHTERLADESAPIVGLVAGPV